ncbi:MAG: hypothetical protein GY866_32150 [Proteobacteria bacterium]|nr:hypothetical protein [Pseudomonadota bacterium]
MLLVLILAVAAVGNPLAEETEIFGVRFANEMEIGGKLVKLNGVIGAKFLFVKFLTRGLYLEKPTQVAKEAIESEQVKQFYMHFLTDKISSSRMREAFIDSMEEANPPDLVSAHRVDIEKYAKWLDEDSYPGMTSSGTYIPGQGLTLAINGKAKGTIPGKEFAQMYFRSSLGDKADEDLKNQYLGLE